LATRALNTLRKKQVHERKLYLLWYGSLYDKYEPHAYWFELVNLGRQGSALFIFEILLRLLEGHGPACS
jgi:hypothetical protein